MTAALVQHPFHPFQGGHNLADMCRIVVIIGAFAILGVIGRIVAEGVHRHSMGNPQRLRFLGLGLLCAGTGYGVSQRFGIPLNLSLILSLAGILVSWWGVLGMRRDQKRNSRT